MKIIKTLVKANYTLFNVDETKAPCHRGKKMSGWNDMPHDELIKKIELDNNNNKFGLRLGVQGNGKNILSLDFDCCSKNKDTDQYVDCKPTIDLLDKYYSMVGDDAGVFRSSTTGNKNILIDYSDTTTLKEMILSQPLAKIQKDGCHLELLMKGNQVIPPTMTKCKKTNKFVTARTFLSDTYFRVLTDNDPATKFIIEYINSIISPTKPKPKKKIKINVKKANTSQIDKDKQNSEQLLEIIDIKYWDDFDSWKRIVWAMKQEGYSMEVARQYSQKSSNYKDDGFNNIWNKSPSNITISQGTINYYAKMSDENKYYKIAKSHKMTDDEVMDINTFYGIESDMVMSPDLIPKNFADLNKEKQEEINDKVREFENEKEEDELNKKCLYFEGFHFKVMNPPCFGRTSYNKTLLLNASEIELQYENVFVGRQSDIKWIKHWRSKKYIRTFENVDFLPPPLACADYTMNTFNGLRAEKLPACDAANIDLLINHIGVLSGNDAGGTQYIINYLAHAIQKPGELPRVALVFQSDQGTGKNIFFENFVRKLMGTEYLLQTAEMDKVIGRFSMINNKLFVIMDETSGKDSFTNSDKIKNIITCEQIPWERKGIDGININNCGRYLFFSNNDTPVKIEASDRRYVVFKCSNERQNDSPYFKKMSKMFSDDAVIKTLYNYLLNVDISKWDSIHDRPITQAYKDIQSANIPSMAKWLEDRYYKLNHYVEMGSDHETIEEHSIVKSNPLFQEYKNWLVDNGFKNMDYNVTKFGRELNKYDGVEKKRKSNGMVYVFDFEDLKKYLINKKYMEADV